MAPDIFTDTPGRGSFLEFSTFPEIFPLCAYEIEIVRIAITAKSIFFTTTRSFVAAKVDGQC